MHPDPSKLKDAGDALLFVMLAEDGWGREWVGERRAFVSSESCQDAIVREMCRCLADDGAV